VLVGRGSVKGWEDIRYDHASFEVAEAGLGREAGAENSKAELEAYGKVGVEEAVGRCSERGTNLKGPG